MTYYESAENITISRKRAIQEVTNHGVELVEFDEDMGVCDTYQAQEVLEWLGY